MSDAPGRPKQARTAARQGEGTSMSAVQIEKLWSTFRTNGVEAVIHKDLDLTIAEGEFLSVVGGSGSGKTVQIGRAHV